MVEMGHTLRIYNKKIKKAQRNNCYHPEEKMYDEMTEEERYNFTNDSLRNSISSIGIYYHPYAQVCMGHCAMCKDHNLDQKHIRKHKKVEFRQIVAMELGSGEDPIEELAEIES